MGALMIWDGTAWQIVSQQGPSGGNAMWVGPSAPPGTPVTGDEWFDTDEPNVGLTLPLSVTNGGTGAASAPAARTTLAMPGEELAYNQITASASITGTTAATANLIIEGTSRAYDGSPVLVEFYTMIVQAPNIANVGAYISLWDGASDIGYLADVFNGSAVSVASPVFVQRRIVPTVGTHNYRIAAFIQGGAGSLVFAGAGGAASFPPAYVRVVRA